MTSQAPGGRDLRPLVVARRDGRGLAGPRPRRRAVGVAGPGRRSRRRLLRGAEGRLGPPAGQHVEQPRASSSPGWPSPGMPATAPGSGLTLGAHPGLATAYAVLVVLLGPGSMAMHATQTRPRRPPRPAEHVPRVGVRPRLRPHAVRAPRAGAPGRGLRSSPSSRGWRCTCEAAACRSSAMSATRPSACSCWRPSRLEVALIRRRSPRSRTCWFGLARSRSWRWPSRSGRPGKRGHAWCRPDSLLQQHGAWHVLCAVAAYLLFRHYAAERAVAAGGCATDRRLRGTPPTRGRSGDRGPPGRGVRVSGRRPGRRPRRRRRPRGSTSPEMSRSRRSTPVMRWNVAPAIAAPRIGASQNTHSCRGRRRR